MKTILSTFIIFLFISYGCTNSSISQNNSSNNSGQASLKLSEDKIPSAVSGITAFLTNKEIDTLMRKVNVFSDSSVSINFIGVPKGSWHLKVIAYNKSDEVLYTGYDNLLIQPGKITNVNIDLLPDNKTTGNIQIKVNWGKPKVNWIDYSNNPLFTVKKNPSNPNGVSTSKIIFDDGIYKMFYSCIYNAGKGKIWYAESENGIIWNTTSDEPVFESDTRGTWDDYNVSPGAILKDKDGNYRMYYNGWSTQEGKWQIGLAISTDCINWHRYPYPVLIANDSNEFKIGVVSVLKINNLYYLYYGSNPKDDYNNMKINLALSIDGIHWEKYSGNPIIKPSFAWEGVGITFPSVIYDNDHFVMIYSCADRTKFGIAYSNDGKKWTKNSNYEFSNQMTSYKYTQINYPFLMKVNDEYRLYYTATTNGSELQICLALASKL